MKSEYQRVFRQKNINPIKVKQRILKKFQKYDVNRQYTYDEMLFLFDQKCQLGRCDRDVTKQLFEQTSDANNKSTIKDMVIKYVQNLQTSKLCILREQSAIQSYQHKSKTLLNRKKAYIYLKIKQVSVYARYSGTPVFSYRIQPSDIPPVTLVNALNPILNHEYALQLEENQFSIVFLQSGIPIFTWQWPDSKDIKFGEYQRIINAEGLTFNIDIKYMPINSNEAKQQLKAKHIQKQDKLTIETLALTKLCNFQPFLKFKPFQYKTQGQHSFGWKVTESIKLCLPFMEKHIRNLYYVLIGFILIESLAAMSYPMQFLDVIMSFYIIGIIFDRSKLDIGMTLWICIFLLFLFIIKSVWGTMIKINNTKKFEVFLILAIVYKLLVIFMLWFSVVRKQQYPIQRNKQFYDNHPNNSKERNQFDEEISQEDIYIH